MKIYWRASTSSTGEIVLEHYTNTAYAWRLRLGKHQDSGGNKTNCFPRDLTLSV